MPSASEFGGSTESFLRSETLVLCEFILPSEVAFECLVALGNCKEPIHLIDQQDSSSGSIRDRLRMKKLCQDLFAELASLKKYFQPYRDYLELYNESNSEPESERLSAATLRPKNLIDIEARVISLRDDLRALDTGDRQMNAEYTQMLHTANALESLDSTLLQSRRHSCFKADADEELQLADTNFLLQEENLKPDEENQAGLPYVLGVIESSRAYSLRLKIWRRFRLTALYSDVPLTEQRDLRDSPMAPCNVFIVVSVSGQQKTEVSRVCSLLGAQLIEASDVMAERVETVSQIKDRLNEMRHVFLEGEEHRKRLILNGWSNWKRWFVQVSLINAIYEALGRTSPRSSKLYYTGQLWCPPSSIGAIQRALTDGSAKSGAKATVRRVKVGSRTPPTRTPNNPTMSAVRHIVYQFGVPRYKEIDPTVFTAVTFPFLFGVMFGDSGHGLLLLVFSLLLFASRRLHPRVAAILEPLTSLRHLLLACSIFAIYCGLVCNEAFGKPIRLLSWRSQFQLEANNFSLAVWHDGDIVAPPRPDGHSMSLSADPLWGHAKNQVRFFNSARMKLSVILGFLHLILGLSLNLINDWRCGSLVKLCLSGLPKLAFFGLLMGYLVFLIVLKWTIIAPKEAACAPSLLPMFIAMYRFHYPVAPCYLVSFYPGQRYIEHAIVILVCISAALVAFGLPLYHLTSRGRQPAAEKLKDVSGDDASVFTTNDTTSTESLELSVANADSEFDYLSHAIHCFEFLLSSVSHSASYLRLWAIGLAHGELTSIMWPLLLLPQSRLSISHPVVRSLVGGLVLSLSFTLWALVTICILVGLEGLTALLHSLRLHWIEFQSKFYYGDGYQFEEFSLSSVEQLARSRCRTKAIPATNA